MENYELIESVCSCFDEIIEVFSEIEKEVNELYICSPDDVDVSVERINKYREIADDIFGEIEQICGEDESGELKKATEPRIDRKEVKDEFVQVYEKRQDVNAVAFRIQSTIPMVEDRLKKAMEKTLEEIRENNSGQGAKAAKYYSAVNSAQSDPMRGFTQKSRII